MNVVVHYRSSEEAAADLADRLRALDVKAWTVRADLAARSEVERLIERAVEHAGRIDVLVNNASIFPSSRITDFDGHDLDLNVQVNAFAPLVLSRAFAAQAEQGLILNFLDSRITDYDAEHVAYHLSKRMLLTITRMLALELAPGIRVNGVAPGLVLPPAGEDVGYLERHGRAVPLQRFGDLEGIVETVRFLAMSDFITGQVVFVDGGAHLKGAVYG
jgi:NAD(P)-dependent dehydrogenase (short-subunit alcohol dehydrogenase family)